MKKLLSIVVALTFMLGLIGCSNKEKIPSINEVSQMKYSEVNEALTGKDIQVIRDVWLLDESMLLMITYNDTGIIESCELVCGTPLAPAE